MATTSTLSVVKGTYWFPGCGILVADIDAKLHTHIFYGFASLDPNSNRAIFNDGDRQVFSTFTETLQRSNSRISTLLSIGGGGANPRDFSAMARQAISRQAFINSFIQLARDNKFFGLDIDWEYPEGSDDMKNYDVLITELRDAVDKEVRSPGIERLLLTAAVHRSPRRQNDIYPVNSINKNLDWINVMNYDYYGPDWEPKRTNAPAALYSSDEVNTNSAIQTWITMGQSPSKIVMGLPFYGYAWKLRDPNNNLIGAEADGAAVGAGIGSDGSIHYNRIETFINNGAHTNFDENLVTNYCYAGTTWIGYDNEKSIEKKVLFARNKGLLGYFTWSVGFDLDFVLSRTDQLKTLTRHYSSTKENLGV